MADGTLHGAFELAADQPIRQLHGIRDAGLGADEGLRQLGGTMDRLVSPIATQRIDAYKGKIESIATTTETTSERMGRSWDNATRKVSDQITVIEGRIDDLDAKLDRFGSKSVDATVGLDGVVEANAQLAELEARLDRLDRRNATARVGLSSSGGGLFGGGGGGGTFTRMGSGGSSSSSRGTPQTLFSAVGGLPTIALAGLGLSPGIMGLLGGATSLVGSAGAAALGAGVVGLGGAGIGAVGGLGAFAGIKEGVVQLQALTKAQTAYNTAVAEYGKASTQAAAAQQKLRQEEVAHAQALPMFRQLTLLKSDFATATAPAQAAFYRAGTDVLYNLRRGIPSFGRDATVSTTAVGRAATTYSGFLTSQPSLNGIATLTNAFATNLPTAERSLQNLTQTAGQLAVAAIPFFHEANVWVANWTSGLAKSTSNTAQVQTEMQGLVNSAKDWGRLLGSAAGLLKDIFSAGTPTGNSMVVSLTHTLDRWDQWINTNPQKVDAFFTKAERTTSSIAQGVAQIAGDFAKLGQMLGPIFDRALGLAHILLSLGPGGLSLAGGALFGGLRGLRGAGYRVPSGGSLASSYLLGSPSSAMRSTSRAGGGTVVPLPLMAGGASAETRLLAGGAAPFERVGAKMPILTDGVPLPPGSAAGESFYAAYGGVPGARFTGTAPILAAERDAAGIVGSLRSAAGTARSALTTLGEGVKTFGVGALRIAGPLLAFQAVMNGLSTQPGVPGTDSGGGAHGFALRLFHGFGIGPGYTSPTTYGQRDVQTFLAGLHPGVSPVPALLAALENVSPGGTVTSQASRTSPVVSLTPAQYFAQHPQQAAQATGFSEAAVKGLSAAAGSATTPGAARTIQSQVATLRLYLPPWEQSKLSTELQQITDTAFRAAGTSAAQRWETALDTGLNSGKPMKAISTVLSGMTEQIKHLGPQGSMAMARSMGQWAQTMEEQNPKLIKPMEALMNGIVDRMNQANKTVGTSWQDLEGKIFWFNGQILKGTSNTWDHIGHALTDPLAVAQERSLGIFAQIQKEAISALTMMGIAPSSARAIVTAAAHGGSVPTLSPGPVGSSAPQLGVGPHGSPVVHARGGVIGGSGLLDTVRMPDGSMAAPGEAWIANGPTMDALSRATIPVYGKTAWQMIQGETIPHSSWGRVFAPGATRRAAFGMSGAPGTGGGGSVIQDPGVNMSVGQEPQILQDLYRLSARLRQAVYVISGYRSPAHSVAVGGFANDPHTQGAAADIGIGSASRDSMFGVQEGTLNAVGLYRPFYPASAAEVNHVQLMAGGAHGGAFGGGARGTLSPVSLRAPRSGMLGVPGVLLNAASTMYAGGLQRQVNKLAGTMGGGSTAGLSGSLVAMVNQLSHRFGWGPGDVSAWLQVINAESGGSTTATNPSSGAYGIAQFINGPSEYAQYGGNSTTQAGQLLAMANYIHGRYGTPTSAWGHEQRDHWYERGGRVAWGGWHHRGADFTTNGPMTFGAGDGRRERVRITPATSQTARGRGGSRVTVIMQHVELSSKPQDIERVAEAVGQKILDHLDGADESDLMGVS